MSKGGQAERAPLFFHVSLLAGLTCWWMVFPLGIQAVGFHDGQSGAEECIELRNRLRFS